MVHAPPAQWARCRFCPVLLASCHTKPRRAAARLLGHVALLELLERRRAEECRHGDLDESGGDAVDVAKGVPVPVPVPVPVLVEDGVDTARTRVLGRVYQIAWTLPRRPRRHRCSPTHRQPR